MRFFLIFIVSFFSQAALADSFKQKHFDPVVERATDRTSLQLLLLGAGAVIAVRPSDEQIRDDWRAHQKMSESTAHAGDMLGLGVAGVIITGGQYVWDENPNHFQSHARALVYSTLVNFTLKNAFQRPRPNRKDRLSFPSGHTMTAFTTATSLAYAYGWKTATVAYPLATLVALSRLSDDAHWGSDVVGGAFVGLFMARASFYKIDSESVDKSYFIYPQMSHGTYGASLVYNF